MLPRPCPLLALVVAVFATLQISQGFQLSPGTNNALSRECATLLFVASQDTDTKATEKKIPYSVSRGDGSTGGGGRPMPNQQKNQNASVEQTEQTTTQSSTDETGDVDEELKRPKVGAEMPHGRPSWFRVPAPSQGTFV